MQQITLAEAFEAMRQALATGDLDAFYGAILPEAKILDEDLPFGGDRAAFEDHISFHGPDNWQGFAWVPRDLRFTQHSGAGSVVGYATFRGKPVDAGYRIRPMMFSQGWRKGKDGWKLALWHQSPIVGHITRISPA
ncbi:MAG: nuclear transport factor 2 family protein [Pseudomonadota bacterium]